jgi:Myb-like DNA-binding domain
MVYPHTKNPPWPKIAESIPGRSGKQCRERFKDHLDPNLRQAEWSQTEDAMIFRLYSVEGSKWSRMTKFLPGRTDNNIKNRFHHLRKRFEKRVQSISQSAELDRVTRNLAACHPFAGAAADQMVLRDLAFRVLVANKRRQVARYGMTDGDYKFGPFREVTNMQLQCQRCGLLIPSPETSRSVCTRSGWCKTCVMMTPVLTGDALRIIHTMKTLQPTGDLNRIEG